ncbi:MAG: nucleoside/nucleotide kinase family protein [Rhodobacteraceae bacterium]|nr:nucleoside/nucleotide kinase family protein [Paracoccaceae bacterium]
MSRDLTGFAALARAAMGVTPRGARALIALAGPPASGKSTLAPRLAQAMTKAGRPAQVVPMDGFHMDDAVLTDRGLLPRKGSPETFDLRGFTRFVTDLASGGEVFHPIFDRRREIAIGQAGVVPADCACVIVEGNYLLLDEPGWRDLGALWDLSIYLPVPADVLEQRLLARWTRHGLTPDAARAKAGGNDLPNGTRVASALLPPDIYYKEPAS